MKVLQVMSSTNVNSGIANVIMNYFRAIDKSQVTFDFLVFSQAEVCFDKEIESLGGKVYYFTKPGIKTYFQTKRDLKKFFAEHSGEYDIVHCNEILVSRMVFKIARQMAKVSVCISHSHNSRLSSFGFFKEIRNRILVAGIASKSDYCFACSKQAAISAFGRKILKNDKLVILPNATNLDNYSFTEEGRKKTREEFGLKTEYVLCNVGRLCYQKNQIYLIDILKSLKCSGLNCKLILAGDGDQREFLKSVIEEKGLQNDVIFTGIRKDVAELLSASDLFVFPSIYEGLGLALVEAQANGLKCLATDSLPEEVFIADNVIGLSLKNQSVWVETVKQIAETGYDRTKIAYNTYNSDFQIKISAKKLLEKYKTYLNK